MDDLDSMLEELGEPPLYWASVRHCATMITLDHLRIGADEKLWERIEIFSQMPPRALETVELPEGKLSSTRASIEALLCADLDRERLKPAIVRRSLNGPLNPVESLIDATALKAWAGIYGLYDGEFVEQFIEGEGDAFMAAVAAIVAKRSMLKDPINAEDAIKTASTMSDEEVAGLLVENARLREAIKDTHVQNEKPMSTRERGSLLRIIRVLCVMAKLPDRGFAEGIVEQLQLLGFQGPGDDTIRTLIKQARSTEP